MPCGSFLPYGLSHCRALLLSFFVLIEVVQCFYLAPVPLSLRVETFSVCYPSHARPRVLLLTKSIQPQTFTTKPKSFSGGSGTGRGDTRENKEPPPPMNYKITAPEVRLIVPREEGKEEMVGVLPTSEALRMAIEMQLDLVLISDKGDIPVCKILDFGKYRYTMEKKKKVMQKKTKSNEVKEVKLSYKIDDHDFDVRSKAAQKFLQSGNRVKILVMFKGREMAHKELGQDVLTKITTETAEWGIVESPAKFEGKQLIMYIAPRKK